VIVAPPPEVIARHRPAIESFLRRINVIGPYFPDGRLTSWYRDPHRNQAVGGHPMSQHLRGLAVDVVVPRARVAELRRVARLTGLTAIDEGDHVHLQYYA
jgi:hypothetical protein